MATEEYKRYHGYAIAEFLDNKFQAKSKYKNAFLIERIHNSMNSLYSVNGNCGLFFKHSKASRSPWQFTFGEEHVQYIKEFSDPNHFKKIFIVLICGFNSVCVLSIEEIKKLIDFESENVQSIRVKTFHNSSLHVSGSFGKIARTFSKTFPFQKVYEYLDSI